MADQVLQNLIDKTLHRIGELAPDGQQPLYDPERVGEELRDAMRDSLDELDDTDVQPLLETGKADANNEHTTTENFSLVPLPGGFLRLYKVKLSAWSRNADQLYGESVVDDLRYGRNDKTWSANDPFAGLSVRLDSNEDPTRYLTLYPRDTATDPVEQLLYVPDEPDPENMPHKIQDLICWDAAGRLLRSDKDFADLAAIAEQRWQKLRRNKFSPTRGIVTRTPRPL